MMPPKGLYSALWNRHLKEIYEALNNSITQNKECLLPMNSREFTIAGDRPVAGYRFRLEIVNGKVTNNISGSAVARDLFVTLSQDISQKEWLAGREIMIRLDGKFILHLICKGK